MGTWERRRWRKLYIDEVGSFATLPLFARALAAELLKLAKDDGCIQLGGKQPAEMIAYTMGATQGDRRLLRVFLPMLLKDGYLELRDGDLWIRNLAEAQNPRERSSLQARSKVTTAHDASRERADNEPETGSDLTTAKSLKKRRLDKIRRDRREESKRVPAAPAAVRVSAAIDPASSGAPTPRSSAREPRGAVFPPDPVSPGGPDPKTAHTAALALTRDSAFHRAVDGFHELFKAHRRGASPAWGEKQGAMIKKLLARVQGDPERVLEYARRMFAMAPRWPAENPDLGTLVAHWDKFAPQPRGPRVGGFKDNEERVYRNGDVEL